MSGTRRRFFRKSLIQMLAFLIAPMVFFTAVIIQLAAGYASQEADRSSEKTLSQMRDKMEMSLSVMDGLYISFDTESEISTQLRIIVRDEKLIIDRAIALRMIRSHIASGVHSRPYIDSVYVYLDNPYGWVLTSDSGLEHIERMQDQLWFESYLANKSNTEKWTEYRPLIKYAFQQKAAPNTVSLYRIVRNGQGVIVMNLALSHLERELKTMCDYEGQILLVLNEANEPLLSSDKMSQDEMANMLAALSSQELNPSKRFMMSQSASFGWQFVSIIPQTALYALANRMMYVSFAILVVEMICGIVMATTISHSNYHKLKKIYEIFDAAESGRPLPPLPERIGDEYSYITQNLLVSYITQNSLTMQLEQKRYRLKKMELLALQSQINPHFLVNTLRTVFWRAMAMTNGEMNDVTDMIESLTALLDFSLSSPHETVTLFEELEATRSYVHIQRIRRQNQFDVLFDIDDEVLNALLPRLILQPLVENSMSHGFIDCRDGAICVTGRKEENFLLLTVSDNGIGMTEEKLNALKADLQKEEIESGHIGLYNTAKRIELYFDQQAKLEINSSPQNGTQVRIRLPLLLCDETHSNNERIENNDL